MTRHADALAHLRDYLGDPFIKGYADDVALSSYADPPLTFGDLRVIAGHDLHDIEERIGDWRDLAHDLSHTRDPDWLEANAESRAQAQAERDRDDTFVPDAEAE